MSSSVSYEGAMALAPTASYRGVRGHLLTLEDSAENAFLKWYALLGSYWLSIQKVGANWSYSSGPEYGQSLTFSNWYPGHPLDSGSQCANIDTTSGRWFEASCMSAFPYVIEYECGSGYAFDAEGCTGLSCDMYGYCKLMCASFRV